VSLADECSAAAGPGELSSHSLKELTMFLPWLDLGRRERRPRNATPRLRVEALECREVMSANAVLGAGMPLLRADPFVGQVQVALPQQAAPVVSKFRLVVPPPPVAISPIERACRQAFIELRESSSVSVNGHGFRIKPAEVTRTADSITVRGFIFHSIVGRDDRVYYTIEVRRGQPYVATIERIELGGLFGTSGTIGVGVTWAARAGGGLVGARLGGSTGTVVGPKVGEFVADKALKVANWIQRKLIGNWTPSAPRILDGIASYFAKQLQ
jgi:hypothetical protein